MYQFQHLPVDGPTFFKEQLGHLMIAVEQNTKRAKYVEKSLSEETAIMLEWASSLGRDFTAKELAERFQMRRELARDRLMNWAYKPELYNIRKTRIKNNIRYYEAIV